MQHQRRPPACDHRPRLHPEKILQARFDPGRFAGFIIDAHAAAAGDRHEFRRHLVQQSPLLGAQTLAQRLDQCAFPGGRAQFGEAPGKVFDTNSTRARKSATVSGSTNLCNPAASAASARTRAASCPPTVVERLSLIASWSYIIRSTTSTRSDCAFYFASVVSRN